MRRRPIRDSFVRGLAWIDDAQPGALRQGLPGRVARAADGAADAAVGRRATRTRKTAIGREFFQAIKSMTINGYYTTEIGLRQELGDSGQLFLGQFQGCTHPEHQG